MIAKIFRGGRSYSGAKSAFNYLLNERVKTGQAKVINGDPNLTLNIIKNIKNKWKFSSGVLSFEELIKDENQLKKIIAEFEKTFFPGLSKDEYNITWILHTDKNRTELHFIAPRLHLPTGKAYNPYYVKKDFRKKDLFQDYINAKYNLSSPHQKEKQEATKRLNPNWNLNDRQKLSQQIDEFVAEGIAQGLIKNRDDIIYFLEQEGAEITRKGKNYISVKFPEIKKALKLKGDYYAETFTSITGLGEQIEKREREHIPATSREFEKIERELNEIIQKQAKYNKQRYKTELGEHRLRVRRDKNLESNKMDDRRLNSRDYINSINTKMDNNKLSSKLRPEHDGNSIQLDLANTKKIEEDENVKRAIARVRETRATIQSITENATTRNKRDEERESRIKARDKEFKRIIEYADRIIKELDSLSEKIDRLNKQINASLRDRISKRRKQMDVELERFKSEINLKDFFQELGYETDSKKSTRKTYVLKNAGEVLIVSRDTDGHYVYFNAQNPADSGTIIDYIQKRTGKNLGQVRKTLRAYMQGYSPSEHLNTSNPSDIREYYNKERYFSTKWNELSKDIYEWQEIREISGETIKQNEFVRTDENDNYYFAVFNEFGITGLYKTDNRMQDKKFEKGSIKGIWGNKKLNKGIKRIIITETPIDSLSIQELNKLGEVEYDESETLHIATLGRLGDEAKNTLEKVFNALPNAKIVLATDNDSAGQEIASEVLKIADNGKRETIRVTFGDAKDANEYLQNVKEKIRQQQMQQRRSYGIRR